VRRQIVFRFLFVATDEKKRHGEQDKSISQIHSGQAAGNDCEFQSH
jgi:hypothetical protein